MSTGLYNATPLPALAPPLRDAAGRRVAALVVKATFAIGRDGRAHLHDEQAPLRMSDVLYDPAMTAGSIRYPSDLVPAKVGADVIVVGAALAPRPVAAFDVAVKVRDRTVPLRVHGPRVYFASMGKVAVGPASPTDRVPIVYERAYGGMSPDFQLVERKNPSGIGVALRPADLDGKPAPQIEHPIRPYTAAGESPDPVGFGAIASHWSPRCERGGTRDDVWRRDRLPLPPADFDPRFYNAAHPSLQFDEPLRRDDEIAVFGMSREVLRFALPAFPLRVRALFDGRAPAEIRPPIDTLLVEPEKGTFEIAARASFPVGRGGALLREIRVDLYDTF